MKADGCHTHTLRPPSLSMSFDALSLDLQYKIAEMVEEEIGDRSSLFHLVFEESRSDKFLTERPEYDGMQPKPFQYCEYAFRGVRTVECVDSEGEYLGEMGVLVDLDTAFGKTLIYGPCFSDHNVPSVRIEREFDCSELSVRKIELLVTVNDDYPELNVVNRKWETLSKRVTPVPLFSAMHCVARRFKQYRKEQFFLPLRTELIIAEIKVEESIPPTFVDDLHFYYDRVIMSISPEGDDASTKENAIVPTLIRPVAIDWE